MSRERDDAMWRRIEDALQPTPEELSWTEGEIEMLHVAGSERPLSPPPSVLMQAAQQDPFVAEQQAAERRRRARRHLSAAATFLLASASLAWISSNIVWPRQQPQIWSTATNEASDAASSADSDLSDWQRALGYFSGRHSSCLKAMQALSASDASAGTQPATSGPATPRPAEVQRAAREALHRYIDDVEPQPSNWSSSVDDAVRTAVDSSAEPAVRCEAIHFLEHFLRYAEASIASASAATDRRATIRSAYLQGLLAKRSRLTKPERTEG